jgi:hypothetical protein
MICQDPSTRPLRCVNSPGGISKHYRVQVHDPETNSWRMYASFRFVGEAEACLDALAHRGIEARLIAANLCPTAY